MSFRYQKQPFMLTNDEGVTVRMADNGIRDGWHILVYRDSETNFAFHASNRELDELGYAKMRGRWEIAHLGGTSIGEVRNRGFLPDKRRRYLAIISDALRVFPVLNSTTKKFETLSDVHYVDAKVYGL